MVEQYKITGHCLIKDAITGEVILDKNNAIHFENMSLAIVQSMCRLSTLGPVYQMAFGNGGSTVSDVGTVTYLSPNVTGINANLYNQTYVKIVNDQDTTNPNPSENYLTVSHVTGNLFTDLIINCTLDFGEPSGQQFFDTTTNIEDTYVFDEIGIKDYAGSLLAHVIFSPVQKSSNRSFSIVYTIRYQMV